MAAGENYTSRADHSESSGWLRRLANLRPPTATSRLPIARNAVEVIDRELADLRQDKRTYFWGMVLLSVVLSCVSTSVGYEIEADPGGVPTLIRGGGKLTPLVVLLFRLWVLHSGAVKELKRLGAMALTARLDAVTGTLKELECKQRVYFRPQEQWQQEITTDDQTEDDPQGHLFRGRHSFRINRPTGDPS